LFIKLSNSPGAWCVADLCIHRQDLSRLINARARLVAFAAEAAERPLKNTTAALAMARA
jgi:hypothetical protein